MLNTNKTMEELYKVKEECSLHLSSLTPNERSRELQKAVDWYEEATGKRVTTDDSRAGGGRKKELARV